MEFRHNITYRKKDKGWQYIISYKTEQIGKWKQKSKQGFPSKSEAKKAADKGLEDLKINLVEEELLSKDLKDITFGEFKYIFLEHIKLYKAVRTVISYETAFNAFEDLNNIKLSKITNKDIQKCIDNLTKNQLRSGTIKTYLKNLKVLFKNALEQYKIISELPTQNLVIKSDKEKKKKKALTLNEFYELIYMFETSSFNSYTGIVFIAGTCGLRIGEILGLTWNDIDLDNGFMKINKQWKVVQNTPLKYGFDELKTKNSYRILPIPPTTLNFIKNLKELNAPKSLNDRLFNFKSTDSTIICINDKIKKFGFDITLHELRHTYATTLISNNVDFKTAANLLGHDVKQTMDTYSHVTDEMLKKATDLVNNIFEK